MTTARREAGAARRSGRHAAGPPPQGGFLDADDPLRSGATGPLDLDRPCLPDEREAHCSAPSAGHVPGRAAGALQDTSMPDVAGLPTMAPVPHRAQQRRRTLPEGVVRSLLHSAVALQAEDLLRSIGALAVASHRSEGTTAAVDWIAWVERDVRDLGLLARAALAVGATLPAGLDVGGGDPDRPETVIEGLLAGHEEVLRVLRHLDALGGSEPWNDVVGRIVARREAEAAALRVTVGPTEPPDEGVTHVGRAPDALFTPDLLA